MQNFVLLLKAVGAIALLCTLCIYGDSKIQQRDDAESKELIEENEARQDALEEQLRPYIERNKKINEAKLESPGGVIE
jgi:hypothetical protein